MPVPRLWSGAVTAAGPPLFIDGEEPRVRRSPRFYRDLLSVVLILIGVVGALVMVFVMNVLAGYLVSFASIAALGVVLGTNRGG